MTYQELMALTDEQRYAHNVYHRWDHQANYRKLAMLYGRVAVRQDADIASYCRSPVLDIGSGYGFFACHLRNEGLSVLSIDTNDELRDLAYRWYGITVWPHDAHALPFEDGSYDTVVFREVAEHLDCERAFAEAARVSSRRIIVFQSHLSLPVRTARWLSGHTELHTQHLDDYRGMLYRLGHSRQTVMFRDTIALPLSGGLLTMQRIVRRLEGPILRWDERLTRLARRCHVDHLVCWRFLLCADKLS